MDEQPVPLTEENLAEIKQKLEEDAEFVEAFAANPSVALASVGYYVPEELLDDVNRIFRENVAATVAGVREGLPDGSGRNFKVSVSLEEPAGS